MGVSFDFNDASSKPGRALNTKRNTRYHPKEWLFESSSACENSILFRHTPLLSEITPWCASQPL
jgi:hypothetical protein